MPYVIRISNNIVYTETPDFYQEIYITKVMVKKILIYQKCANELTVFVNVCHEQATIRFIAALLNFLWPLLLTWFNFNPSMEK